MLKYHAITRRYQAKGFVVSTIRESACGRHGVDVIELPKQLDLRRDDMCQTCAKLVAMSVARLARALQVHDAPSSALAPWHAALPASDSISKDEVVGRLCRLATEVSTTLFQNVLPSDCFCRESASSFQFAPEVVDFIEASVRRAIATTTNEKE
jgi:hypothetical protein